MKLLIGVILVVIALIMKKREAKSAEKTPSTPRPAMPADEVLRRHREMVEQQMRQLQEQQPIDSKEYDEDENYDEDEEYEEEDEEYEDEEYEEDDTPVYEPIPAAYDEPVPVQLPQPAQSYYQQNMNPTSLADGLPVEGVSAFANAQNDNDISNAPTSAQQDSSLTADDMRRAIIYQTILERPKF